MKPKKNTSNRVENCTAGEGDGVCDEGAEGKRRLHNEYVTR